MEPFQYNALEPKDEIRILDLLPRPGPISSYLRTVRLSDKPQYEALSYCWGTSAKKQSIQVNGQLFAVGPSLYSALRYLRRTSHLRTFGIDAICINQRDNTEKSIQVARMREIYEQCSRAVIWLGTPNFLTRRAFRVLRVLLEYSHIYPLGHSRMSPDSWRHAELNLRRTTGRSPKSDRDLKQNFLHHRLYDAAAFWCLWRRPWFSRIWILQEATFCPDAVVNCGHDEISWTKLVNYWWQIYFVFDDSFIPDHAGRPAFSRSSRRRDIPVDLFTAFALNEGSSATDPRDKIYAVLGFVKYHDYIKIEVDYSKDPSDVFVEFTRAILKSRPNLNVLVRSRGDPPYSRNKLPSWSLSFDLKDNPQLYAWSYTARTEETPPTGDVRATRDSKPEVKFIEKGQVLGLLSASFDEIELVGDLMPSNNEWADMQIFRTYLSWRKICDLDSPAVYQPTGQRRREMFWRMMTWHSGGQKFINVAKEGAELDAFDKTVMTLTNLLPGCLFGIQIGIFLLAIWGTFFTLAKTIRIYTKEQLWLFEASVAWERRMCRTSRGFVGLGPPNPKAGDVIFLVNGSGAPLAFRPYGTRWRLVGETYIHGIMLGEAFDGNKCETMWVE